MLAVPDKSAFIYRRVTFKTPERMFLLSQYSAWGRGGEEVYSFWIRSRWLFADSLICMQYEAVFSLLCKFGLGE